MDALVVQVSPRDFISSADMLEPTTYRSLVDRPESWSMNTQRAKYPLAILSGLALVGGLAGCSTAADGTTPTTDGGTTDASTAPESTGAAGS